MCNGFGIWQHIYVVVHFVYCIMLTQPCPQSQSEVHIACASHRLSFGVDYLHGEGEHLRSNRLNDTRRRSALRVRFRVAWRVCVWCVFGVQYWRRNTHAQIRHVQTDRTAKVQTHAQRKVSTCACVLNCGSLIATNSVRCVQMFRFDESDTFDG